jgi:hypothetical protein
LPIALLVTAAWQLFIWYSDLSRAIENGRDWRIWLCLAMVLGACGASTYLLAGRPRATIALGIGLAALLVTPVAWALGPSFARANVALPYAALPGTSVREDPNGPAFWRGGASIGRDPQLLAFLRANHQGEHFLLATLNARLAAPIIIETGEPVMAIGGFMGADPILTPERFASLAADGQVRFVLLGGDFPRRAGGESPQRLITDWIKANGALVDPALWRSTPATPGRTGRNSPPALYDLRPAAELAQPGTG